MSAFGGLLVDELAMERLDHAMRELERRARTMQPDNSAPLMTHDITEYPCNGLEDCPVHRQENKS